MYNEDKEERHEQLRSLVAVQIGLLLRVCWEGRVITSTSVRFTINDSQGHEDLAVEIKRYLNTIEATLYGPPWGILHKPMTLARCSDGEVHWTEIHKVPDYILEPMDALLHNARRQVELQYQDRVLEPFPPIIVPDAEALGDR